jgi:hypothetical protein
MDPKRLAVLLDGGELARELLRAVPAQKVASALGDEDRTALSHP